MFYLVERMNWICVVEMVLSPVILVVADEVDLLVEYTMICSEIHFDCKILVVVVELE
jgi:hypothetical protein